jgi:hypothetical protein
MNKNLDDFIAKLFKDFTPKQQKVLAGRFGLKNGKRLTLQEIGEELGVTRERVRQIEEQSLKKIRETVEREAKEIIEMAKKYLSEFGGVRRDDVFMEEISNAAGLGSTKNRDAKLRFIFAAAGAPQFHKEDDSYHAFWYLDKNAEKKLIDFIKGAVKFFQSLDPKHALKDKKHMEEYKDEILKHYLSIAKHFGVNTFGDFGLREWAEIEPKTIRDKAYLALRKTEKPLHFEDIAKAIHSLKIDRKPAHVQTVHNELIKDERFVLVGRGVYALREDGFEPGTVRQVIARLLKQKGPMHAADVIRFVNESRFLKENTILLNLQNRKFFKRLDDGRYHSKEA